ncbi:MAG: hypothetical protein JWM19_3989 [Actinomycetia bacterium]|nr:hypothetical protein [Actinomycetes bacterium]
MTEAATGQAPAVRRPAPVRTEDNAVFWDACRDGRLVAQRCADCGRLRHPPRPMCPRCGSLDIEVAELSGRGTVYSYAALHHPQSPAFDYPVLAVLVDLEEGVRLLANLEGVAVGQVRIGMPVAVGFAPTVDGYAVPVFRPAGGHVEEAAG